MPKPQRTEIAPPLAEDKELIDFASVIQSNLVDLHQLAHDHPVKTDVPASNEGQIGDLQIRLVSGTYYIYAKVSAATWKRVALS